MTDRSTLTISAIVAAVLFAIGYAIVAVIPGGGEVTEEDFTDFYSGDPSFFTPFLLVLALLAGCWTLVWFFSELRTRLPEQLLSRAAYAIALVGAGALAIGGAILFAPAGVQMNSDGEFVGAPVAHAFAQAGLLVMLLIGMYSLALAVALYSLALRRAGLIPAWLAIGGGGIAVLLLGSFFWLPGYLLVIWILVVGLIGLRRSSTT
ncbi:hypothetical protein BH23CHL2_BH23CHL2_19030 [soil metagenome]